VFPQPALPLRAVTESGSLTMMFKLRHAKMPPSKDTATEQNDAVVSVKVVVQADCGVVELG
jgi:hypothetical protein